VSVLSEFDQEVVILLFVAIIQIFILLLST